MNFMMFFLLAILFFAVAFYFVLRLCIKRERESQSRKIADLFHDLKSPLTSILGYVELLNAKERTREQQEEFLGIIEFEAERLLQMLGNGIDSKRNARVKNSTNCAKVISLISRGLSPDATKKGVTVNYNCDPNLYVDFEENKLWRVVTNLVENAIKYNKPGGSLNINAVLESEFVIIEVDDTGVGIRPENITKVFSRGFRENTALPGFGYGLSTVRQIVAENGGHIKLESEYGKGTKFTLKLRKATEPCSEAEQKIVC